MSKIGKKLLIVFLSCIIFTVTTISVIAMIKSSSIVSTIMLANTESGVEMIEFDLEDELDYLDTIFEALDGFDYDTRAAASNLPKAWNIYRRSKSEFLALTNNKGEYFWSSENYNLADISVEKIGDGYSGIVLDSNAGLTLQYTAPVKRTGAVVGYVILGRSMTDTEWIDDIGDQTNLEVTFFSGNVRVNTTLKNTDGTRVIGTTMADNIANIVLEQGGKFSGTANLVSGKHYVAYHPIKDSDGNVIGALFAGASAKTAMAAERSLIITIIIVALAIAVGASVLVIMIITKIIIKPINEANVIADDMSQGYLTRESSNFHFAGDEIGDFVHKLEDTKIALNTYIGDISHVLSVMSAGDFTVNPGVDYIGDFKEIRNSFQGIKAALFEIVTNIQRSTNNVNTGVGQINEASQVLAEGTTRQAASIEELSASINAIAEKVHTSSENAEEASRFSVLSGDKITYQNNEVENMLAAMDEIKKKSDQIQNIIAAIDGIAFQTNILALNAAIEAARAGEAGKGFAVVADEVRNLAAKSSDSAAQTGELINATIAAVNKGMQIANSTANTMKEVTDLTGKTNQYITEISDAAREQATSITQIKQGIDQISEIVQQNSANAEETAASCVTLNDQAQALGEQIGRLHV